MGIPRDLLRRRPDVRAAGLAAASQSALIGVAKANMYPAFSLSGSFGVAGNNAGNNSLADMFNWQSRAVNAGAGLFSRSSTTAGSSTRCACRTLNFNRPC